MSASVPKKPDERPPRTREAPKPFEHPDPRRAQRLEQAFQRVVKQYGEVLTRLAK